MKKTAPFLLVLTMFLCHNLTAQRSGNIASSVGISGGYAEDGIGIMGTFNFHLDRFKYFQVSVFASIAEDKGRNDIPYNIFTIQPGQFWRVYISPRRKNFSVFLGGGGVVGYEVINGGSNELSNGAIIEAKSQFIYGAYAGVEAEMVLGDDWSLLIKANEYYHLNSDVGNFYPYAGIGLRYFLF